MKKLFAIVLMAQLLTCPIFAQSQAGSSLVPSDELNKALPQWLRFSGDYRARLEGFTGGGFKPDNDDAYLLSRLRLNMQIQPTSWLRFFGQAQDARVFWKNQKPASPPYQNTMDLRQAYVELGNTENQMFGLRLGRQELVYGDQRLVGNANWLNTARSFDAVRATFRYQGYRLDAFTASVVNPVDGQTDHHQQGNNLHGLYGGMEKLVPNAVIEPYVFWRTAPRILNEAGQIANLDSKTIGFRWVGKLPAGFDYGSEIAGQTGSLGADRIGSWAGHWVTGYTLTAVRFTPRFLVEYNYASGDRNAHDGKRGTFDQLYPTAHDKYGLADQVGWRNIRDFRAGVELKPRKSWMLSGIYHDWWLASATDGLYNAAGVQIARKLDGSAGTHVGQELDAQAMWTINKQMQVGGGFGHIFPGEFLQKTTPGKAYSFPYLTAGLSF